MGIDYNVHNLPEVITYKIKVKRVIDYGISLQNQLILNC